MKEIVEEKEQIISHIEQKLAELRLQRNKLEKHKYSNQHSQNDVPLLQNREPPAKSISRAEKIELQNNLNELQKIYDMKKELREAGIYENDINEIFKYKNDPNWVQHLEKRKKTVAEKKQKMKVVEEEMIKTKQFLGNKKVNAKELQALQVMNYRVIFKDKKSEFEKYDNLVNKATLNNLEKSELIYLTFNLLKEHNGVVNKSFLQKFLLANNEFCECFGITHAEINRDLDVFETKESGILDDVEFMSFIKTIEITNKNLGVGGKAAKNKNKQVLEELKKEEKFNDEEKEAIVLSEREYFRRILEYLRKLFGNLDRGNEGIVERTKFIGGLQRGLYWDNKIKKIGVQDFKELSDFIRLKTKEKCRNDYYKELESKYIKFAEIELFSKEFTNNKYTLVQDEAEQTINESAADEQVEETEEDDDENLEEENESVNEIDFGKNQERKRLNQKDYERYGWNQEGQFNETSIGELDKYYKKMGEKYGNEIAWNGYSNYKSNFKQLEAFIQEQDEKYKKDQK